MGLPLSVDGLDMLRRRLPTGASPNLVGREVECRLKQKEAYYLDLALCFYMFLVVPAVKVSQKIFTAFQIL